MLSFLQYLWLTLIQPAFHHLPTHTTHRKMCQEKKKIAFCLGKWQHTIIVDPILAISVESSWSTDEYQRSLESIPKAAVVPSYLVHTQRERWCLSLLFVLLCVRIKRGSLSLERATTRMHEDILICSPKYWRSKPQFNWNTRAECTNVNKNWRQPDGLGQEDAGSLLLDLGSNVMYHIFGVLGSHMSLHTYFSRLCEN